MTFKSAAIPTRYNGVQFRSRLEARWAAMFDLLGWSWEYEPIDLRGYIPDFFVYAPDYWGGKPDRYLVEIKPVTMSDCIDDVFQKAVDSGWTEDLVVLGREFSLYDEEWTDGGDLTIGMLQYAPGNRRRPFDLWLDVNRDLFFPTLGDKDSAGTVNTAAVAQAVMHWREAGNCAQWRSPSKSVRQKQRGSSKKFRHIPELTNHEIARVLDATSPDQEQVQVPKSVVMDFFRNFSFDDPEND